MNGVHDMGGMQGFGPIQPEANEPVFHAPWEARVIAMRRVLVATGKVNSTIRPAVESLSAVEYLSMSNNEKWYAGLVSQLIAGGVVTREEIEKGKPGKGSVKGVAALKAADAAALPNRVPETMLNVAMLKVPVTPRFHVGERVRARTINPPGHTRLPRYVRGRAGVIERDHGVQAYPDTNTYGLGENPQHVYAVRFAARELWGEQADARDSVYLDLWEGYLE